jgi:hypothetical protein
MPAGSAGQESDCRPVIVRIDNRMLVQARPDADIQKAMSGIGGYAWSACPRVPAT